MTQDARFCGTTASMCGVETALGLEHVPLLQLVITQPPANIVMAPQIIEERIGLGKAVDAVQLLPQKPDGFDASRLYAYAGRDSGNLQRR